MVTFFLLFFFVSWKWGFDALGIWPFSTVPLNSPSDVTLPRKGEASNTFVRFQERSSVLLSFLVPFLYWFPPPNPGVLGPVGQPLYQMICGLQKNKLYTHPLWEVSAVMQARFPIKTLALCVIKCDTVFFSHGGDQGFGRSQFHSPPTYQRSVLYCLLPVAPTPPLPLSCSLPLDLTLRSGSSGLALPFVSSLFLLTEPSSKSLPSSLILLLLPHNHKVENKLCHDLSP